MYSPRIMSAVRPVHVHPTTLEIARKCGNGVFGEVYESRSGTALKIVVDRPNNQQALQFLKREAIALVRCRELRIPHIIEIKEYFHNWHETLDSRGELIEIHKTAPAQSVSIPCDVMALSERKPVK